MSDQLFISEIFSSIQGEGYLAGRRQVFIRMLGCNLECRYCDTEYNTAEPCRVEARPGSAAFIHLPQPLSLQAVLRILADWIVALPDAHHSISLTGGEPLLSADVLAQWLPQLHKHLPIHLETNGTLHGALEQVIEHVDYISMDMKLPSSAACHEQLWDRHRFFLQTAQARNVSVKVVVSDDTAADEIRQVCDIIAAVNPAIPLFLQPLSLSCDSIGISGVHILALQEVAASLVADVRVIPQMHKLLKVL